MSTRIHELKSPKEPQMWFVASDWHYTGLHLPTFNVLIKHALSVPLEHRNLIINGDFLDLAFLMPKKSEFQQWVNRKDGVDNYFLPLWEEEIKWGNDTLDALQCVFKNIIFIHGNHDNPRADTFREEYCPIGYKEHFHLSDKLNLLKRGIGEVLYGDWLDIMPRDGGGSHLAITHGSAHGATAHKKHFEMSGGRSVIFGHIHHYECKTFASRGHSRSVWSLPCMAGLNPHYIKNLDVNWQNGYGTLYLKPSGDFNFYGHIVKDGELLLPNGEIIK